MSRRAKTKTGNGSSYRIKYFAVPNSPQSVWVIQLGTNVRAAGVSVDRQHADVDAFERLCELLHDRHMRARKKLGELRMRIVPVELLEEGEGV